MRRKPISIKKHSASSGQSAAPPQATRVSGVLEEMGPCELQIRLKDGSRLTGQLTSTTVCRFTELLGRSVALTGVAHFDHGGEVQILVVDQIEPARSADAFFNRRPSPFQRDFQFVVPYEGPAFADGPPDWPGDETVDEIEAMVRAIRSRSSS